MSGTTVEYLPEARQELDDAFDWYLPQSRRAAEAFLREVDRAIQVIAASPRTWPAFEAGTRRYVLQKFPYSLVFRAVEGGLQVVAVAHHKRRPRYWRSRLTP